MRSQIVGASPLLDNQLLAHSFPLWRRCRPVNYFLALFENRWCACGTMFKDLLEEVSQGEGEERASAATWPDFRNVCQLMATAVRVVKTSFVSAGTSIPFFFVLSSAAVSRPHHDTLQH